MLPIADDGNDAGRDRAARPSLSASALPHLQGQFVSQDAVTSCRQASVSGWGSQRLGEGRAAPGKAARSSSAVPGSSHPLPKATGVFSREASPADDPEIDVAGSFTREWSAAAHDQPAGTDVFSRQGFAAIYDVPIATGVFSKEASAADDDDELQGSGVFSREVSSVGIAAPAATGVFSREASAADDHDEELHDYQVPTPKFYSLAECHAAKRATACVPLNSGPMFGLARMHSMSVARAMLSITWVQHLTDARVRLLQVLCSAAHTDAQSDVLQTSPPSPASNTQPAPASDDQRLQHQWPWSSAQQSDGCNASLRTAVVGNGSGSRVGPPTPPAVLSQPLSAHSAAAAPQAPSSQAGCAMSVANISAGGALISCLLLHQLIKPCFVGVMRSHCGHVANSLNVMIFSAMMVCL